MSDRDMVRRVYGDPVEWVRRHFRIVLYGGVVAGLLIGVVAVIMAVRVTDEDSACGKPFAEAIDPRSSQHVLPDGAEPKFSTDPPTSGAHKPGDYPTGVLRAPIERTVQVTLLEQGEVLVQYRGVPSTTLTELRAFANPDVDHVTVAPNPGLRSKIVATAWLWKMECRAFDETALLNFVRDHQPAQPVSA